MELNNRLMYFFRKSNQFDIISEKTLSPVLHTNDVKTGKEHIFYKPNNLFQVKINKIHRKY